MNDDYDDDDDPTDCRMCDGTGEGLADGSFCYACHGTGVEPANPPTRWEDEEYSPYE